MDFPSITKPKKRYIIEVIMLDVIRTSLTHISGNHVMIYIDKIYKEDMIVISPYDRLEFRGHNRYGTFILKEIPENVKEKCIYFMDTTLLIEGFECMIKNKEDHFEFYQGGNVDELLVDQGFFEYSKFFVWRFEFISLDKEFENSLLYDRGYEWNILYKINQYSHEEFGRNDIGIHFNEFTYDLEIKRFDNESNRYMSRIEVLQELIDEKEKCNNENEI